jgi:uronate dehydrogenase
VSTVLLTGAAGRIGTALRERLPGLGWTVRPFDLVSVDGAAAGDVTSPQDLDAAMPGSDALVHLAGKAGEAPWPLIRDVNIEGTARVFDAARRHGVRRVVYASSIHAVGFTHEPADGALPADLPPRPDTLYGVSKAFGEALARYYVDRYGFAVACLRIGTFAPVPPSRWALSTWLSPDDCAGLVDACLRAPSLDYALVWGISGNTRRTWSLTEAEALGYRPVDDAEAYAGAYAEAYAEAHAEAHAAEFADGPAPDPRGDDAFVGGGFTGPGFGIDEVAARAR